MITQTKIGKIVLPQCELTGTTANRSDRIVCIFHRPQMPRAAFYFWV
jgi:hypothetical protein